MTKQTRDPEVRAKPTRRTFTAVDKRRILVAADTLKAAGKNIGPMLRLEGLYRSQLSDWREVLAASGDDGLTPSKRGPKGKASTESKLKLRQRDRRIATLERKLEHQARAVDPIVFAIAPDVGRTATGNLKKMAGVPEVQPVGSSQGLRPQHRAHAPIYPIRKDQARVALLPHFDDHRERTITAHAPVPGRCRGSSHKNGSPWAPVHCRLG